MISPRVFSAEATGAQASARSATSQSGVSSGTQTALRTLALAGVSGAHRRLYGIGGHPAESRQGIGAASAEQCFLLKMAIWLNEADVRAVLPMADLIDAMASALYGVFLRTSAAAGAAR